jgi:hypothetical protein
MGKYNLTPKKAKKYLRKLTNRDKAFWFNHGKVAHSLEDAWETLKGIPQDVYEKHVNDDKNDLQRWVEDVVGDMKLANRLKRIKRKKTMKKAFKERIKELKKVAKKANPKA